MACPGWARLQADSLGALVQSISFLGQSGSGSYLTRASSTSGFSALPFHVFIVWGLKIETLVKDETLDKLISPWPSFLTNM